MRRPAATGCRGETPYRFLQDALHAASGDPAVEVIRVAQGVYPPDRDEMGLVTPGDRAATFSLLEGVFMSGGYAGIGGPDPDEQDPALYETRLSGDLLGDDVPGLSSFKADNAYHVLTMALPATFVEIEGFTIVGGYADLLGPDQEGGGLRAEQGCVTLSQCLFRDNWADLGAAVAALGCGLTLDDAAFHDNRTFNDGSGGAILATNAAIAFDGCEFEANHAPSDGRGGAANLDHCHGGVRNCTFTDNSAEDGGAIRQAGGSIEFDGCSFEANTCSGWGGAIHFFMDAAGVVRDCDFAGNHNQSGRGGAITAHGSSIEFMRCRFLGNSSKYLGGAANIAGEGGQTTFLDCRFTGNAVTTTGGSNSAGGAIVVGVSTFETGPLTMINCLLDGNSATGNGGAVFLGINGVALLTNCTIARNTAGHEGGGVAVGSGAPVASIANCIVWNNSDSNGSTESSQLRVFGGELAVDDSCVEGWTGMLGGAGNLGADPLFADPDNGDFRLAPGSPCIDAGDGTAVPEEITTDLDGYSRFVDDPQTPDTGAGDPPIVDMGPYEHGGCLTLLSLEVVCNANGEGFTVNAEGIGACGGAISVSVSGSSDAVGEDFCFTVPVYDGQGGFCCFTGLCVGVPDCASPAPSF